MPILGLRHTANFITNQRPENWREAYTLLYPNGMAALTAFLSLAESEAVDDPVYHWWNKDFDDRRLKLSAAITNVATALSVDPAFKTAFIVKAGDVLLVEDTGEIVRVSADPSANNALTVTRAQAGTTGTALDPTLAGKNPYLMVIGSAFEEGSLAPTGVNYDPAENFNYTQIFRNTLELTRTAAKTRLRTKDAVAEAKRECLELHGVDMERAFWFGKRSSTTLNGKPMRTTAGLEAQIAAGAPENIIAAPGGGLIDSNWLETNMEKAFRFGSNEKVAFGSNVILMAINQVVRKNAQYQISTGQKEYGINVSRVISPFGELVFKTHPLFNQMRGGTTAGTPFAAKANNMYILDMKNFRYRYFRGDDMRYERDLAAIGLDGQKSGYISECGLELHNPKAHMIFTGITGGAADA